MKKALIAIGLSLAVSAFGQSTNAPTNSIWGDLGQLGKDAWADLATLDFGDGIKTTPFFLIHPSSGHTDFGGGLSVSTAHTNAINYGFAAAALTDSSSKVRTVSFYDASLSISINHVFVLSPNVVTMLWAETGPATDLSNPNTMYVQSFSGADVIIGSSHKFSVGGFVGNCSKWSQDLLIGGDISYTF